MQLDQPQFCLEPMPLCKNSPFLPWSCGCNHR